uniref:Inositol polyphosphate-related phosphatase domain-containing protein n=1 Tax=Eutreptiella gymnastica TaxID=73025 RepID=A0A7S4LHD9_9EUGL
MEGTCGPADISDLVQPGTHHVYVIGTEECERSIAKSYVNSSKDKWEEKLISGLGEEYKVIASETLMAIHIIVFVRHDVAKHTRQVNTDKVPTGLLNGTVGNKGAVCVSCLIGSTSLLFVNAHFAAHQNHVEDRNGDYKKIVHGTTLRCDKTAISPVHKPNRLPADPTESGGSGTNQVSETKPPMPAVEPPFASQTSADATQCFDVVFWSGDLNYRINGLRNMVDVLLKDDEYRDVLIANDQLSLERKKGNVFNGFQEGAISFNPTYKYHKEDGKATNQYDKSGKARIPAWTDRILYKTNFPFNPSSLTLNKYYSLEKESLRVSDHRPVVACVTLETESCLDNSIENVDLPSSENSRACVIS